MLLLVILKNKHITGPVCRSVYMLFNMLLVMFNKLRCRTALDKKVTSRKAVGCWSKSVAPV